MIQFRVDNSDSKLCIFRRWKMKIKENFSANVIKLKCRWSRRHDEKRQNRKTVDCRIINNRKLVRTTLIPYCSISVSMLDVIYYRKLFLIHIAAIGGSRQKSMLVVIVFRVPYSLTHSTHDDNIIMIFHIFHALILLFTCGWDMCIELKSHSAFNLRSLESIAAIQMQARIPIS